MSEAESEQALPGEQSVGARLAAAREAAGLSRADIAARTRIAERHIVAIDEDRFSDLASSTYAVGFARQYARALGLDEQQVADDVREALAAREPKSSHLVPVFEPGDPARVPGTTIAWGAALGALVVVIVVWILWPSYYSPSAAPPDLASPVAQPRKAVTDKPAAIRPAAPAALSGDVVFTAMDDNVWVKFYDAAGTQLMQKIMARGETFQVPATAQGPQVWTARPDALAITVGGKPVAPLADRQVTVKDVPVTAAALLARPVVASATPSVSPGGAMPGARPGQTSTVSD